MKNTREYLTLIGATKEKDLRRMALRSRMPGAESKTKEELVAAFIEERDTNRREALAPYLMERAARTMPKETMQGELFA